MKAKSLLVYWGKVEEGESLTDYLRRELHEELGVTAEVGDVMAESEYQYDHEKDKGCIRLDR